MAKKKKKPYLLRLPSSLFIELKIWAKQELRSINRQIEIILIEAVKRDMEGDKKTSQHEDTYKESGEVNS